MVVVENDVPGFQLHGTIASKDKNRFNSGDSVCDPVPSNMIYHQKINRKNSPSSYNSVEINRMRNQDPNLLNRPAWTDARIALLQIKKVILYTNVYNQNIRKELSMINTVRYTTRYIKM